VLKPYSFEHPLLVTRFLTCLLLAGDASPHVALKRFDRDGRFRQEVTFFDGRREVRSALQPDAFFVLHDREGHYTASVFLEVDRETEPLRRRDFEQSSFRKKVLTYLAYWRDGARLEREIGSNNFLVATVTLSKARAESLAELVRAVAGDERSAGLFWFTTKDRLSLEQYADVLSGDIWTTATGTRGSLL
jgi:hypothetical protein